ncbi:MAG: ketoacyl-ACP synthase III [Desulfitobacteriaceae bacterium]|nr:ketoacyl-ACP synthase III [Desulfitobacteriaceae bacterium]MDD4346412.1 ketoacyl-ACP synthase III [Desulfitobacteriaceae bacterium]MDD4400820.1 ketoacyl-ACP synthase III [Desulfitobacteriaceae bacterium]
MKSALFNAHIAGIGTYIPEKILTNFDLEKIVDTSDQWILERTGIRERHIASAEQAASDLGVIAAQRALDDAGLTINDMDLIITTTVTPDMLFPSTACIIQEKLGNHTIPAFDLNAACAAFIYGLVTGTQFIATGTYRNILLICTEALSSVTNWKDRSTCVLLADGAGAVVLQRGDSSGGVLGYTLGADGRGGLNLYQPAGGSRMPATLETVQNDLHFLRMNGQEIYKFAVRNMVETAKETMNKAGLNASDVDLFIPHQANARIIEGISKRLEFPQEKVVITIDKYGNNSSATIPLAMNDALKAGRIKKDSVLLLVGFGAGLTWGGLALKWTKTTP